MFDRVIEMLELAASGQNRKEPVSFAVGVVVGKRRSGRGTRQILSFATRTEKASLREEAVGLDLFVGLGRQLDRRFGG